MSLPTELFKDNRKRFLSRIPVDSAVVLFAGSSRKMSQDSEYRFLVDRNFYYLSGSTIETAKMIMVKREEEEKIYLFIPPKDDTVERWHGRRMTAAQVSQLTGIDGTDIYPLGDFEHTLYEITHEQDIKICYDGTSISDENRMFVSSRDGMTDISMTLTRMRMVKSSYEIDAIKEAAGITEAALEEMKSSIVEGACETDIYTALEYGLARRGSLLQAFPTITAIDGNAFYLHHSEPEGADGPKIKDGSFVQIDVGARYEGYCADISRVYFAGEGDGTVRGRRVKLLDLERRLRKAAFEFIKPGETFKSLNDHIKAIVAVFLTENGLCEGEPSDETVKQFYWHNTSHHLGLDVHDISDREMAFEEGNCLAVEPGVYIPQWNIGFRIEDDVLVTAEGCTLLSSGIDTPESVYLR